MMAFRESSTDISESEMRKTVLFQTLRLAIGGAFLGLALTSILASLLSDADRTTFSLIGAVAGGVFSFAALSRGLHLWGRS